MCIKFSKELYPKAALIKAAYHFTQGMYVHLGVEGDSYTVELTPKTAGNQQADMEGLFKNELLAQTARLAVLERTERLRELVMARAFASTIIEPEQEQVQPQLEVGDEELEAILRDWYG